MRLRYAPISSRTICVLRVSSPTLDARSKLDLEMRKAARDSLAAQAAQLGIRVAEPTYRGCVGGVGGKAGLPHLLLARSAGGRVPAAPVERLLRAEHIRDVAEADAADVLVDWVQTRPIPHPAWRALSLGLPKPSAARGVQPRTNAGGAVLSSPGGAERFHRPRKGLRRFAYASCVSGAAHAASVTSMAQALLTEAP